jgi:glycosyltransferase involved in cell wall biosynthesis
VFDLLDAFGVLRAQNHSGRLLLGGTGRAGELRRLSHRIQGVGTEFVDFRGWIPPHDRGAFLGEVDVFVLFSESEWFGLSALEARMAGCGLIASDLPSLREALEHDPLVEWVARNEGRPGLVNAMISTAARVRHNRFPPARFPSYGPAVVASAFEDLYHSVRARS